MTDAGVLELAQRAVVLTLMMCAPTLGVGLLVGLLISVFQAATQIQEMTLSFVPKIAAVTVALIVCGPWMLRTLVTFTTKILTSLPSFVH
jgi:flagellar biosynthetic protein FliQ